MSISPQEQKMRAEARQALLQQIKKQAEALEDPPSLLRLAEAYSLVSQEKEPGRAYSA
ncbi:hypothetical protein ABZ820_34675 [Streptomyces diacarni]|uniref:hypothetical protein n=1 Tax=Streptomyces diacarni TaxID=2800381 RepID=UPI0033EC2533